MRIRKPLLGIIILASLFLPMDSFRAQAGTIHAPPSWSASKTVGRESHVATAYELSPHTAYFEGCVGTCRCPVKMAAMKGSFRLAHSLLPDRSTSRYRLHDIAWKVVSPTGKVLHQLSGTGTYWIDNASGKHRLVLDILIDGKEGVHLDSGQVPGGIRFPTIAIGVDHGAACYDIWMRIEAKPSP